MRNQDARAILAIVLALAAAACARIPMGAPAPPKPMGAALAKWAEGARILPNLGDHHRKAATSSAEAQAYFDQGLRLAYGFNHDEAARSFVKAAQLDPACAACWWGAALVMGPNYNVPMMPEYFEAAWDAMQHAQAAAPGAEDVEKALIEALSKRFAGPQPLDPPAMVPYVEAYAAAMREVAAKFPKDDDVQVLFAESLMNTSAWKLWSPDGNPAAVTPEILRTLETVLARSSKHPGANHYYIHTVEASPRPEKGIACAERLGTLMPGAGHLVHMPAHIFQRVGRYADASAANASGARADQEYLAATVPPGYYPMYFAHNYHFLAYSAAVEGRFKDSLAAARKINEVMPRQLLEMMPGMDFYLGEAYLVLVRFGDWKAVLSESAPHQKFHTLTALWHFARGMAYASTKKLREAKAEQRVLREMRDRTPSDLVAGLNSTKDILALASEILSARIMLAAGRKAQGLNLYRSAVSIEDKLSYNEPADWFFPVRHLLGAALIEAGKPADAEDVYWEDLRRNPGNGWALRGLVQALRAQKKDERAAQVEEKFERAWKAADVKITASAY